MARKGSDAGSGLRYRRIVAKLGTNLLTAGTDELDMGTMSALVDQVARLRLRGAEMLIVTSGAIAAGRHRLGAPRVRRDIPQRQVFAAVGQSHLMQFYDELFHRRDIVVAQSLLTRRDLSDRQGYLNARNTLLALIGLGVVPIINENDTVATDEIRETVIGDNDTLSALVANLLDADALVILTDIDGLYTADPRHNPGAERIARVENVDAGIEAIAGSAGTSRGVGGMLTKVRAAALATASGVDVIIADGREPDVLTDIAGGIDHGTLFPAREDRQEGRRRYLLSGLSARGSVVIDAGATRALCAEGRSLLPAGVSDVQGAFERGDAVNILDSEGTRIARGISNYRAADLRRICGIRSDRIADTLGYEYGSEAVHRNNLVLLTP